MLGVAKNGGWGGLTHTQGRANEIDKDNQILVQKLSSIAIKPTMNTRATIPFRANPGKTTVAINRRKKDDQIARENAALAKRLNSVKPTSTLSNKATAQHAKNHSANLRNLNDRQAADASDGRWWWRTRKWDDGARTLGECEPDGGAAGAWRAATGHQLQPTLRVRSAGRSRWS